MKRILSIRKSAFLTLCYLQTINAAPQAVTTQKSADIGILLKISITDKLGKEISQASFTTASAGLATDSLAFDFQNGPNAIHVYNDSCGTKKQEIGRLLVTQKDAPEGSEIVLEGTTSQIHISVKKPEKNLPEEAVYEKTAPSTLPPSLLEQIRLGKELKSTESSAPIAPPLIVEPSQEEQVKKFTTPGDRAEARRERRRKRRESKNIQTAPITPVILSETNLAPEAPVAPPFIQEPSVPVAPPFIAETSPIKTITPSPDTTPDSSRQALLEQIRAGKQPKPTPASTKPIVPAHTTTETTQQPSSRDDLLKQIRSGSTTLRKTPTKESAESVSSRPAVRSGGIISDELMKQLEERRKIVEEEEQEDADVDEWD